MRMYLYNFKIPYCEYFKKWVYYKLVGFHDWLMSADVDILPCLLLPLAGPEEFEDDDVIKLPTELQYLEPDKTREPITLIRASLVEALTQVCSLLSLI